MISDHFFIFYSFRNQHKTKFQSVKQASTWVRHKSTGLTSHNIFSSDTKPLFTKKIAVLTFETISQASFSFFLAPDSFDLLQLRQLETVASSSPHEEPEPLPLSAVQQLARQ